IRDFHVTGVQTCALPIFDEIRMGSQPAGDDEGDPSRSPFPVEVVAGPRQRRNRRNRDMIAEKQGCRAGASAPAVEDDVVRASRRSEERRVGKEWTTAGRT